MSDAWQWINVNEQSPDEGELVIITGVGHAGRFYTDAQYQGGVFYMFDQQIDIHIHECDRPDYWVRPMPPGGLTP